jgi:hypothetical protein
MTIFLLSNDHVLLFSIMFLFLSVEVMGYDDLLTTSLFSADRVFLLYIMFLLLSLEVVGDDILSALS